MIRFPISAGAFINPRHVPPSAWIGHIPFASWLVQTLRPGVVVELGTHHGTSFLAFCQAIQEGAISAKCFAVDTWEGDHQAGVYSNEVYMALRDYQQRHYAGISEMLRMTFDDALSNFDDGSVDLLHIDGLHTYEAVRHDFETWLPKLSGRGVILFHDTCARKDDFGVWKFWSEVRDQYPSFEFTHTHGLGVLLVGDSQSAELLELTKSSDSDHALINQLFDALGRNLKNVAEIERVNSGLAACHAEIGRLNNELGARNTMLEEVRREAVAVREAATEAAREAAAEREAIRATAFVDCTAMVQATREDVMGILREKAAVDDHRFGETVAISERQGDILKEHAELLQRQASNLEAQSAALDRHVEEVAELGRKVNRSWFRKPSAWFKD